MASKEPRDWQLIKFDTRVAERFMRDGRLERKDYEAMLSQLPDEEGNFEIIDLTDDDANAGGSLTFTAE